MLKMTKKGNVKEVDGEGNVLAKYVAVPYTACRDCALFKGDCMGVVCSPTPREADGYGNANVHFVLKKPKPDISIAVRDILVSAGLTFEDASRAGLLTAESGRKCRKYKWLKGKTPAELLWCGFGWHDSKEGHIYWAALARQLERA